MITTLNKYLLITYYVLVTVQALRVQWSIRLWGFCASRGDNEDGNTRFTCSNMVIHLMKIMKQGKGTDNDLGH